MANAILFPLGHGPLNSMLKLLVFGDVEDESPESQAEKGQAPGNQSPTNQNSELTTAQYVGRLIICGTGLQGAYLTWGVLQVRLVTWVQDYH